MVVGPAKKGLPRKGPVSSRMNAVLVSRRACDRMQTSRGQSARQRAPKEGEGPKTGAGQGNDIRGRIVFSGHSDCATFNMDKTHLEVWSFCVSAGRVAERRVVAGCQASSMWGLPLLSYLAACRATTVAGTMRPLPRAAWVLEPEAALLVLLQVVTLCNALQSALTLGTIISYFSCPHKGDTKNVYAA